MSAADDQARSSNWELTKWLRGKRAGLAAPARPEGGRRRRPGLTQSEVAAQADISLRFYQHIEMGRRRPGQDILDAVARALQLNPAETAHLAFLTDHSPDPQSFPPPTPESLRPFLAGFCVPAMVIDGTMRALVANELMEQMLPPLVVSREYPVPLFPWLFSVEAKEYFADHEFVVGLAVGRLRTLRSHAADTAPFDELTDHLYRTDPLFRCLWDDKSMLADDPSLNTYRIRVPGTGLANLNWASLHFGPDRDPNLRLVYLMTDIASAPAGA